MSIWDFVIIVILMAGAYRGYQKGLLRAVLAIAGLILGVVAAVTWTPQGVDILARHISISSELLPVFSFLAILIGIILLVSLAGRLLKMIIDLTPIGILDGLVGALLGLFKWALGISLLLWVLDTAQLNIPRDENSLVFQNVRQVAPYLLHEFTVWSPVLSDFVKSLEQTVAELL